MRSDAFTVDEYLASLPDDRRQAIEAVREAVLEHLPEGYEETMDFGMIAYVVPLETHPDTYNGHPLMYAALASQKRYMALYLQSIYADTETASQFERDYRATGKRFDVGKSCVRFRTLDDLPLKVVGRAVAALTPSEFVTISERARGR
jgi:hypothetical protein